MRGQVRATHAHSSGLPVGPPGGEPGASPRPPQEPAALSAGEPPGPGSCLPHVLCPQSTSSQKRFTAVSALRSGILRSGILRSGIQVVLVAPVSVGAPHRARHPSPASRAARRHHRPRIWPYSPACTALCPSSPPSPRCGDHLEERGRRKRITPGACLRPPPQTKGLRQAQGTPEAAALVSARALLAVSS